VTFLLTANTIAAVASDPAPGTGVRILPTGQVLGP
jgi:hypothetical protein